MNIFFLWFGDDPLPGFGPVGPATKERFIVLGTLSLVVLAVLFWILFFRKKPRKRKEHFHRRQSMTQAAAAGVSEIKQVLREREHRSRRASRSRNPTLAETGGLPPVREGEPPAPPQTQN